MSFLATFRAIQKNLQLLLVLLACALSLLHSQSIFASEIIPLPGTDDDATNNGFNLTGTDASHLRFVSATQRSLTGSSANAFQGLPSGGAGAKLVGSYTNYSTVTFWYQYRTGGYSYKEYTDDAFTQKGVDQIVEALGLMTWVFANQMGELMECSAANTVRDIPTTYTLQALTFVPALDTDRLSTDLRGFFQSRGRNFHVAIGGYTGANALGVTWSQPLDSYPKQVANLPVTDLSVVRNLNAVLIGINLSTTYAEQAESSGVAGTILHEIMHNYDFHHTLNGEKSSDPAAYTDDKAIVAIQNCMIRLANRRYQALAEEIRKKEEAIQAEERKKQEALQATIDATKRQEIREMAYNGQIDELLAKYFTGNTRDSGYADNLVWLSAEANLIFDVCWLGTLQGYVEKVWWLCEERVVSEAAYREAADQRAIARALRGNFEGAVEDFQIYIDLHPADVNGVELRRAWIRELQAGRNPITPQVLKQLWERESANRYSSGLQQIVLNGIAVAAVQTKYSIEARSFAQTLIDHLYQFNIPSPNITPQTMANALNRPDVGLRINATVERVWGDWLPYGPRTVQTDPAPQNLTPFRVLVIRMIQGRQLTLTTSEQHALYNLFTRPDPAENWRNSMNGIIGAINQESFQVAFQSGNSTITTGEPAQPTQVEPAVQPKNDPTDTTTPVEEPAPVDQPSGQTTLVTDFERFGTWTRGDETWGTFEQSSEQAFSGASAGKLTYTFPAGAENNYIVFRSPLAIAGEPNALAVQVYGDGSTHFLNAWVEDATGQLWQFTFGRIHHQGWQQMVAPLDVAAGWPNQAVGNPSATAVAYPIRFYAFVFDGYTSDQDFAGTIFIDDLVALVSEN